MQNSQTQVLSNIDLAHLGEGSFGSAKKIFDIKLHEIKVIKHFSDTNSY